MVETAGPWQPALHELEKNGSNNRQWFMLQNLPSCVVAHSLLLRLRDDSQQPEQQLEGRGDEPPSNSTTITILDMCAAPGGKASHVASLLLSAAASAEESSSTTAAAATKAIVVACDKSRQKVLQMRRLFERLGVDHMITPLVLNTAQCVLSSSSSSTAAAAAAIVWPTFSPPRNPIPSTNGCDMWLAFRPIRLIAFCSIRPAAPSDCGLDCHFLCSRMISLDSIVRYQRQFVDCAVQLLKPGTGILTYSTCTLHVGENEGMVRYILDTYSDTMELVDVGIPLGGPGRAGPGLLLAPDECACVRRFDPLDENADDTMGFFLAKFRKK